MFCHSSRLALSEIKHQTWIAAIPFTPMIYGLDRNRYARSAEMPCLRCKPSGHASARRQRALDILRLAALDGSFAEVLSTQEIIAGFAPG